MAYYQNGQYQSSQNHPASAQGHDESQHLYGQPSYPDQSYHRPASFDAGDDSQMYGQSQEQPATYAQGQAHDQTHGHGQEQGQGPGQGQYGSSPGQYPSRLPNMAIQTSQLPYRNNTQTAHSHPGPYQHQNQMGVASHSAYNPAQYPQQSQQPQYHPASYGAQQYATPQTAFPSSNYQPFNYTPSAYQESSLQRQPSVYQPQAYSQTPQPAYPPAAQPPPPPPRPAEYATQYSASYSGYHHESYQPSNQYQISSSVPTRQTPYSPGPPEPPPHDYSTQPAPYSHSSSSAQPERPPYANLQAHSSPEITRNTSLASRISTQSSFTPSPQPSIPSRQHSNRSPQRSNTLDRHPQGRSLPGVPSESESESDYFPPHEPQHGRSSTGFDDIMHDLDSAIGRTPSHREPLGNQMTASARSSTGASPKPLFSPDEPPTHINGNLAPTGDAYINYGAFNDDSDAEAAAGLAAMQALDEQERAEDARRRSGSATLFPSQSHQSDTEYRAASSQDLSDDSDYAGYDLSAAGGGFAADMHYGAEIPLNYAPAAPPGGDYSYDTLDPTRMNSVRSSAMSSEGRESHTSGLDSIPSSDAIHPFPPAAGFARVDTGGTGGLTEPSPHPRRLSYEDGDEGHFEWDIGQTPEGQSPSRDFLPDMFFNPGFNRPLPSTPSVQIPHLRPAGTYTQRTRFQQYSDSRPTSYYPTTPDTYSADLLGPSPVPRSTSLSTQVSRPRVDQPIRSKTDADRQKALRQQQSGGGALSDIYDPSESGSTIALDLPAIPRKKFNPMKLTAEQFKNCTEPWAISAVVAWIRDLAEEETDLRQSTVVEGITALFENKVPTMNSIEAESLAERVIEEMLANSALIREEEWVKFGTGMVSGVLFQLSGTGCYSSKLHIYETRGRCYSHHCMRTLKVVDISKLLGEKKSEDWATYYKLKKADIEGHDRKEIERQNNLHEVVTTEEGYIMQLQIVQMLYRDQLEHSQPAIVAPKKLPKFLKEVFGNVDQVKKVNEDYLLGRLKYRQNEQGPWITGFSDIFREWIRRARPIYVKYAENYPTADFQVRTEAERNLQFRSFLEQAQQDKRSNRLDWQTYLKAPITKLQRYSLLLGTVYKNMAKDSEEKTNLAYAIDEIKAATFEADSKFDEQMTKMTLREYESKLVLRRGMDRDVELNLNHLGREILMKGDLLRPGGKGLNWVETHAVLFDHYLVLAKHVKGVTQRDTYDVSKVPIPMDLIVLESRNDSAVVKSGTKIGAITTTVSRGQSVPDPRLSRTTSTASGGSGSLQHVNTSSSITSGATGPSMVPVTTLETNSKDEKILYPFRVKHLGKKETYTLFAPSAQNRDEWCEAIITAKERHADSLHAQNSEPFKIRVLADTAFGYDLNYPIRRIPVRGTPLDRAIKESEKRYTGQGRPAAVCKAPVHCATVFNQPYGRLMCAIGTGYGVYISEYGNTRGWIRSIQMQNVTQIAVLEEFNLFLLIADKVLIAYHLDAVCSPSTSSVPSSDSSSRRAPQKLSGTKDVGFFATGRMKDRALVFYKKRAGITSEFKVLEPVLQKSTTSRSRFMPSASRRGQTEFFREYDEFYIPADSYGMNLFSSTLAISTTRGVEVLNLDKKQTWSVPNLRSESDETQTHLSSIASRIQNLKPLGMFRLGEAEFLVTFEECAVYVNKHGDVSRGVVMEFVGKAQAACLHGMYLILCDEDFVEIRDAQNGRLKQVVAGKEIRLLDDGGGGTGSAASVSPGGQNGPGQGASLGAGMNGLGVQGFTGPGQASGAPRTVKICMQHPEYDRSHVVVELLLNEGDKE